MAQPFIDHIDAAHLRCGEKVGVYSCKIGSIRKGRRSTVFLIENGRVATVSVAPP